MNMSDEEQDDARKDSVTLQQFLDVAEVILLVVGRDERVELINRKGCEILGRSETEILGSNWFDLALPGSIRDDVRRVFTALLKGEGAEGEHYHNPIVTRSGQERWISWHNTLLRDDSGEIRGTLSSGEDVTESLHTETVLRDRQKVLAENEARITAIVNTVIDGIITIDESGAILSFNPAASRMFGWAPDEVLGKDVSMLMPESEGSRHDEYIKNFTRTGFGRIIGIGREVMGEKKDGTIFPMHLGVGAVQVEGKHVFVGTVRDLTEFQTMQRELFETQNLATLGELAASVAHEIKNPLAAISGVIGVLRDRMASEDPHSQILDELVGRVDQLNRTVEGLLQFARPSSLEKQSFNLWELVEYVINSVSKEERFSNIDLWIGGDQKVNVPVDLLLFQDVLRNLLYNAAEAMQETGEVRLQINRDDRNVTLTISDNGSGIPADDLGKVFRPLFTTKAQGTGLGLALCRRIVQAHGGSIRITSTPDQGTQVTLNLPH